ncbi:MAG: response regulator [Candidatus Kerfeldbacteria bacterium]
MNATKQPTILVVEDDQSLQRAIQAKLELNGFTVKTANTVSIAMEQMSDEINAVWLDHYLPGGTDGLNFIEQMRERPDWKDIPVYVVSNSSSSEKVSEYKSMGVKNYYTKANFRLDEIVADIQKGLAAK